jgi:putative (di)nucleoside polyphosphate hydrolase
MFTRTHLLRVLKHYFQAFVGSGADKIDPHYRLGVGILLVNAQGKIFVGKRKKAGGWQMPQGGVDFYKGEPEPCLDAAWRELWEEVGVQKHCHVIAYTQGFYKYNFPRLKGISKIWKVRFKGQKQQWYAFGFLGQDADINLNATSHPEFSFWKWIDPDALLDSCVPFKRQVYESVLEELQPSIEAFWKECRVTEQCGHASLP